MMKMIYRSSIHPSTCVWMMIILLIHCVKGQQWISIASTNTHESNQTGCDNISNSSSDIDCKFSDTSSTFSHSAWERALDMITFDGCISALVCTLVFVFIMYFVMIYKFIKNSATPLKSGDSHQEIRRKNFVPVTPKQERSFDMMHSISNGDKFVNTSKQWTRNTTPSDEYDKIYNMKFDLKKSKNSLQQNFVPRPISLPPSQLHNNVHFNISGSRMSNERRVRFPVTTLIEQSTVNVVVGDLPKATINMNDLEVHEITSDTKEKETHEIDRKRKLSTNSACLDERMDLSLSNNGNEKSEHYVNSTELRPRKKRKSDITQRKLPITPMACTQIPIFTGNNTEGRLGIAVIDPKGQCPRSGSVSPLSFAEVTESSELENSSESISCVSSLNGATIEEESIETFSTLQNSELGSQDTNGPGCYNVELANTRHNKGNYTRKQFEKVWNLALEEMGYESIEHLEDDDAVKGGNSKLNAMESTNQKSAQYGRLRFKALQVLFKKVWNITPNDVFVDIGHGIGNAVMQSAYMIGCEARGIELVHDRNLVAEEVKCKIEKIIVSRSRGELKDVGEITLRLGRLEDAENRDFIISPPINGDGATKVLVNNFNGVFAERSNCSAKTAHVHLDLYISALFAMMVPGSVMVTLHPLIMPPSRSEVNEVRRKLNEARGKLDFSTDHVYASFYEREIIPIGKAGDIVSWSGEGCKNIIEVYKYTRLQQNRHDPVFLCSNVRCENAINNVPNAATKSLHKLPYGIIIDPTCSLCNETQKNLRSRTTPIVS